MIKIFSNKNKIVYLTNSSEIYKDKEYSIILSPELYWIKKVDLPVKKVSAAKKLAESVFEGTLPSGNYSYEVSKIDEDFIIIAYDKDQILNLIKEKFIENAKVSSIYFAQHEFSDLKDCCGVDEKNSLINLNNLIIQVPRVCTESKKEIGEYLVDKKLSKHKISLGSFEDTMISKKEFYLVAAGVFILAISNIADWVNYANETALLDKQKSQIISKYNLPPTSMQIKSIKSSLKKTYKTQKKIRDELFSLNSLHLQKGEYIESINITTKETDILIKVESDSRYKKIKSEIEKLIKLKSSSFENSYLLLKIQS